MMGHLADECSLGSAAVARIFVHRGAWHRSARIFVHRGAWRR